MSGHTSSIKQVMLDGAMRLNEPVSARALRLTRALTGLTGALYFGRYLWMGPRWFGWGGVLDHEVAEALFWYSWQPLIRPGMPDWWPTALHLLAFVLSLLLAAGIKPRLAAVLLYVIAVTTYRWCFPLTYVDDVVLHLIMLWQVLLPQPGPGERWAPGAALRLACVNIALMYLVAGLTKLGSPMWRDGSALWAVLSHPIAWWPELAPSGPPLWLRAVGMMALVVEPLLALLLVLPKGSALKWPLGFGGLSLHLGIAATMDVGIANLGCLALWPLVLHAELAPDEPAPAGEARWSVGARAALALILLLVPAMVLSGLQDPWRAPVRERGGDLSHWSSAEAGGHLQSGLYAVLWCVGVAQSYRLFDWIDHRDIVIREERYMRWREDHREEVAPELFRYRATREVIAFTYILGVTWMALEREATEALRVSLAERLSRLACSEAPGVWRGEYSLAYGRAGHPDEGVRRLKITFKCEDMGASEVSLEPRRLEE